MTIKEFKFSAIRELKGEGRICSLSPELDVEVFLSYFLNLNKTQLLLSQNQEIPQEKISLLNEALEKRKKGLPVAYITNHKEFYGYDFYVTPDVLIPKPDTEILVEHALNLIAEKIESKKNSILTICDMCTGSGCIALSVIKNLIEKFHIPQEIFPKFILADISLKALEIAKINAANLLKDQSKLIHSKVSFIQTNLFDAIPYKFDMILTNPPYIPHSMVNELLLDGRNEPRLALDGDVTITGEKADCNDGLEIIRNLIPQIKEHLSPLGTVLMETGEYNATEAAGIAERYNFKTKIHKDFEGQLRVVEMN
ncbi:MAG: peptide chain release factor N(5)-glutamine methyltransferase [Spirochaetales bacterium]|nr:peptide chain release factor N(5)-glutamine methyltransferase [Spirochaetales bacterium]